MAAEVTVEALRSVKSALSDFRSDIDGFSSQVSIQTRGCLDACEQKVTETQTVIRELEDEIVKLNQRYDELEEQISRGYSQVRQQEENIKIMRQQYRDGEYAISEMKTQVAHMKTEASHMEDEEVWKSMKDAIRSVEKQIDIAYEQQNELKYQIKDTDKMIDSLKRQIHEMESEKDECLIKRRQEEKRLGRYMDKLSSMKSQLSRVHSEVNSYVAAARRFESSSSSSAGQNIRALDRCIGYVEEYLSVDL